jgi:hypothetical protein
MNLTGGQQGLEKIGGELSFYRCKLNSYKQKFKDFIMGRAGFFYSFLKFFSITDLQSFPTPSARDSFSYFSAQTTTMAKLEAGDTLKRLRNRYRLVVMNDDTYEEVTNFRLSRMSVYVMLCTIFVLLVGLTVALMVFTPLKYYIPGYGTASGGREYRQLKYVTDSLEKQVTYQSQYIDGLRKMLTGSATVKLDTAQLKVPNAEESND